MAGLRTMARFIAIEGESVWGLIQEAVIRLDERKEGHEPEEQFPSFSSNDYISKADALERDDNGKEETDELPGDGHIRDSSDLIGTSFDPIWIRGEDFDGEMSDELKEIVGDGRGKYHFLQTSCWQGQSIDTW